MSLKNLSETANAPESPPKGIDRIWASAEMPAPGSQSGILC